MMIPAGPAEAETARIGREASPRTKGRRRRHQRARHSAAPPITSTTSSGPCNPWWTLLTSATLPSPIASRKSATSIIQSRCDRRAGGVSSSFMRTSSARRRRRAFITASLGGATAADHPTEVDRYIDLGRSTIALRPIVRWRPTANPVLSARPPHPRTGDSHAHPPRAPDPSTPLAGDRSLARPHPLRRLRRRKGVDALVPEPLGPRQARVRGEPADAEGVWHRRPRTERRRLPHERRRDQEQGDRDGDAACCREHARRTDELLLLDRQSPVRLRGPAHDLPGGLPARPCPARPRERRREAARRGSERPAEWDQRRRDGSRRVGGSEQTWFGRRFQRPAGSPY